jgi:hypothetical protein
MKASGQHCRDSACEQTTTNVVPICECDCAECIRARRPPAAVLADTYRAIGVQHHDFGDVDDTLVDLAESLAAVLRSVHTAAEELRSGERSHTDVANWLLNTDARLRGAAR